jgi:hypothetical protein
MCITFSSMDLPDRLQQSKVFAQNIRVLGHDFKNEKAHASSFDADKRENTSRRPSSLDYHSQVGVSSFNSTATEPAHFLLVLPSLIAQDSPIQENFDKWDKKKHR